MTAGTFGQDGAVLAQRRRELAAITAAQRAERLAAARQREEALIAATDSLTRRVNAAVQSLTRHGQSRHRRAVAQRDTWWYAGRSRG